MCPYLQQFKTHAEVEKREALFTYINAFSQLTAEKYLWVYYTSSLLRCFCKTFYTFKIRLSCLFGVYRACLVCHIFKQNPYLFLKSSFSLICSSSFTLRLSFPNCKDTQTIHTTIDIKGCWSTLFVYYQEYVCL